MDYDSLSIVVRNWLLAPVLEQIGVAVADMNQLLDDVRSLKTDVTARLDAIDNVVEQLRGQVEQGQVDQATLDQISREVASARDQLAAVNPEDPSGDDPAEPPEPAPTT